MFVYRATVIGMEIYMMLVGLVDLYTCMYLGVVPG